MEGVPTGGLIRQKLPQQLETEGYRCRTRTAAGRELSGLLGHGLQAALRDFLSAPSAESAAELADLLDAACAHHGVPAEELAALRAQLAEQQGPYGAEVLEALVPPRAAE